MSVWMETGNGFYHMGVAVFRGSITGRRGGSAARRCCFMGHLSSPTWTTVGKRVFEVRPASPRGVGIGYCCTFSNAKQGGRLERSMGAPSVLMYEQCGVRRTQLPKYSAGKLKGDGIWRC